jgi:predicted metal-binding membrane protein
MPNAHHALTDSGALMASSQMPLGNPVSTMPPAHHSQTDLGTSGASLPMSLAMNSIPSLISGLMVGWALMLVAMMSPTLIAPIWHIIQSSFKRRRARSATLFVIGYAAIWMMMGVVLIATVLMLSLLMVQSYLPAIGVGIVAFVWQCSPIKQRCLNRGHNHRALAAFGSAADRDALRFGITHALWCVGSCWALMLLPMMVPYGHFAVMALVGFVMISERLEQPQSLSWRLRPRGTLMRMMIIQTQLQWQRAVSRKSY